MRTKLLAVFFVFAMMPNAGYADAGNASITSRPIQITSCITLPEEVSSSVRPMGYQEGFQIYYLLEGKNLVGIKEDSVIVESIKTPEGTDISKDKDGNPAYKEGSFPKVADEGNYGQFSIEVEQDRFGSVEDLEIKGSVTVLVSSKLEEKTAELKSEGKQKVKVGPFSIEYSVGGMSFMGSAGDDNSVGVAISGPLESVSSVTLSEGDNELESEGSMSIGNTNSRTFYFKKPAGKKITLKIKYWVDLKEAVIPLGPLSKKK